MATVDANLKREVEHIIGVDVLRQSLQPLEVQRITRAVAEFAQKQRGHVRGKIRERLTGDEHVRVRDAVAKFLHKSRVVSLLDKIAFVWGVTNVVLTSMVLSAAPQWFGSFFCWWLGPLMCLRYFTYRAARAHYYMLDLCYAVNAACAVSVLWPEQAALFKTVFVLANGPLAMAVYVWRNSLVFHSLDRTTSLFIHMFPPLVTFAARWFPSTQGKALCPEDTLPLFTRPGATVEPLVSPPACDLSFAEAFLWPLVFYVVWQFLYLFVTDVLRGERLRSDPELETSLRYMASRKPTGLALLVLKVCRRIGVMAPGEGFSADSPKSKAIFIVVQLVYTMLTMLPTPFLYGNFWVHAAFLVFIWLVAVWNGSTYYFHVFARRYVDEFMRRTASASAEDRKELERATRDRSETSGSSHEEDE